MNICLIITTYNWPAALELALKSVTRQTHLPFEVIIADDGSSEETRSLIKKYGSQINNLKHCWHEDEGYRRSKIINESIKMSLSDFIITIDQDCIVDKNFIKDYHEMAQKGTYLSAYRIDLNKSLTNRILKQARLPYTVEKLLGSKWNVKHQFRNKKLRDKKTEFYDTNSNGTYGCNMGFFKNDVLAVNGYNEDFVGWGPEDSEMTQRLINTGIVRKKIFYCAILFHLYHPELSRASFDHNYNLLQTTLKEKLVSIKNGIVKK